VYIATARVGVAFTRRGQFIPIRGVTLAWKKLHFMTF
jgi:hypothetical protein